MKFKKRILIFSILFIALVLCSSCRKTEEDQGEMEYTETVENFKLMKQGLIHPEDMCLVKGLNDEPSLLIIIPNQYIMLENYKGCKKKIGETEEELNGFSAMDLYVKEYENFDIEIYDFTMQKVIKKIDVLEVMKKYPEFQPTGSAYKRTIAGINHIQIRIEKIPTKETKKKDIQFLYYNLETDETAIPKEEDIPEIAYTDIDRDWEKQHAIWCAFGEQSFTEINGLGKSDYSGVDKKQDEKYFLVSPAVYVSLGYLSLEVSTNNLPKENKKLYENFPDLKEFQGKKGFLATLYFANYISPQELITMFLEEGQAISFEGAKLSGDKTIDGLEHEIHSFEEFNQWYKFESEDTSW